MRRLVLLGGGHAQLRVVTELAARPLAGWEIHLVSPHRRQIYSGMLPGWVAGQYPIEACAIAIDWLAVRAQVQFHATAGVAIDPDRRRLIGADGRQLDFDHLSINTGPQPALDDLPGAAEHALPIRPIEGFVAAWPGLLDRLRGGRGFELAVLGAGAAGVELAFAIRQRASVEGGLPLRVTLVGPGTLPLDGSPESLRRRVAQRLAQRGIGWQGGRRANAVEPGRIAFAQGPLLHFDACLVVTGAAAPAWARSSGLGVWAAEIREAYAFGWSLA